MNKVLREEKKFLIGIHDFLNTSDKLDRVLIQDEHNGTHGYIIRSLYYDTPFDDDYFEKQAGVELRRKIRLRTYDPKLNFAMLEMKQKEGNMQLKRSLKVSKEDGIRLMQGDYSPLLKYSEPFAAEMYAYMNWKCYKPKTIVEYHRKAFIAKENKIRITFDNQIVATESDLNLFSENLNMNPVLDPYNVVLEVKFNGFLLSYIRNLINTIDKSELSVSKYVLARQNAYETRL
ncbi:MAG: polyphosphate polymerase domain-containing protein [Clostridia bacterium]|nr:polyphosphate polymerase domain-containing protein [Clostridia bacterium]